MSIETKQPISIIFSSDDNFAPHTGVAICSILENHKTTTPIHFYIIDDAISDINKKHLKYIVAQYQSSVEFLSVDSSRFDKFPLHGHIKRASWYRLIIPELLPKLEKVLYLDGDTICIKDIEDLYTINIDGFLCGAVDGNPAKSYGNPLAGTYFNAGVLLLNLKQWRLESMSQKCISFVEERADTYLETFRYLDQDTLNHVFPGRWLNLPFRYNYMEKIVMATTPAIMKDIAIIHYITAFKPWHPDSYNSLDHYYFKYRAKTPWKNMPIYPKRNFKQYLKRFAWITILMIKKSGFNFLITPLTIIKHLVGFKLY